MELFAKPVVLIWLALGVCGLAFLLAHGRGRRKKYVSLLGSPATLARLSPAETEQLRRWKGFILLAAAVLLFLAWAGPQWGVETSARASGAQHAVIAIDTSLSMLARDIKPNRLENAKNMLSMLIDQLSGWRVGVEAFSGAAYVQCPITTDAEALKYFVSTVKAGMLPEQGTSITDAVSLGTEMLSKYPGRKALIILTDGEDRSSGLKDAAKAAADSGVSVFAVGIGKPEGDLIPLAMQANAVSEYKKDKEGRPVVTKLGEKTLLDLAAATGGAYVRYTSPEAVASELAGQLKKADTIKWKARAHTRYKNRFQFPLLFAVLALLIEFLMPEKKLDFKQLWRSN